MRRVAIGATSITTACMALAYVAADQWFGAITSLVVGMMWLLGQRFPWNWAPSTAFAGFVIIAAVGIRTGLPSGWMLASTVCALVAWDVDHFWRRARFVRQADQRVLLARAHYRRLGVVAALGLSGGGIALSVQVKLNFAAALLLALLLAIGLTRVIGAVKQGSG